MACGSTQTAGDGGAGTAGGSGATSTGGSSGGGGTSGAPASNDVDPDWPPESPIPPEFDFPPWLNMPEPNRIVVSWRTPSATTGTVSFGASPEMGRTATTTTAAELHHVDLGVLEPSTAYWYSVRIDGTSATRPGVFVTPGRRDWRFLHVGEFHAANQIEHVAKFGGSIRAFRPHLLIDSGDMADDGDVLEDWRAYFRTSAPWISNVIILPSGSNHVDGPGGNGNLKDLFVLPNNERWYSTRYGQAQVLNLDSTWSFFVNPDLQVEQPAWVTERTTEAHDGEDDPTFLIGAWHYPACSSQTLRRAGDRTAVFANLVESFRAGGGLDMMLVGHDKYYERSETTDGILHVQTNIGLLAPSDEIGNNHPECVEIKTIIDTRSILLATVSGNRISMRVVDETGSEIDQFSLEK